jgi:hypothetical protein
VHKLGSLPWVGYRCFFSQALSPLGEGHPIQDLRRRRPAKQRRCARRAYRTKDRSCRRRAASRPAAPRRCTMGGAVFIWLVFAFRRAWRLFTINIISRIVGNAQDNHVARDSRASPQAEDSSLYLPASEYTQTARHSLYSIDSPSS